MAKDEIVIKGDVNAAMQSLVNALTYMGGSVTSMNPSRPVEFSVKRTGTMMGGLGAPYGGTATLVPTANNHTKVLLELKPRLWYTAVSIVAGVVALGIIAALTPEGDASVAMLSAVLAAVLAGMLYLYYVPWPQKVLERIKMGVHGAVNPYDLGGAGVANGHASPPHQAQPAHAPAAPAAPVPPTPPPSSSVADQLRQLNELHQQGLISEGEFESKKAEVLKRL